jgi:hypothetical protein
LRWGKKGGKMAAEYGAEALFKTVINYKYLINKNKGTFRTWNCCSRTRNFDRWNNIFNL